METEFQMGITYASLIPPIFGAGIAYLYQFSKEVREQKSKALHDYYNSIATMVLSYSSINAEDLSNAKKVIADRYKVPRNMFPIKGDALHAVYFQILSSDNMPVDVKKEFRRRKELIATEFIAKDEFVPDLIPPMKSFAKEEFFHENNFFFALFNCFFSIYLLCKDAEHINLTFGQLLTIELTFFIYGAFTALLITIVLMLKNYSWREWKSAIGDILRHSNCKK